MDENFQAFLLKTEFYRWLKIVVNLIFDADADFSVLLWCGGAGDVIGVLIRGKHGDKFQISERLEPEQALF